MFADDFVEPHHITRSTIVLDPADPLDDALVFELNLLNQIMVLSLEQNNQRSVLNESISSLNANAP